MVVNQNQMVGSRRATGADLHLLPPRFLVGHGLSRASHVCRH
ncbi:Uncharacterised protein [Vibrio cholerae]|nr:Uncharacterised protein [Vibrio cholerae]